MKLGVSHQTPGDLHQERFDFLLSLGVEAVEVRLPNHEADIERMQAFIRDLGELGIPHTTYAWHTGGMYETHRDETRGVATRGFSTEIAHSAPQKFDRSYTAEELWESYERFIEAVLPVAQDSGVKLQLHPNDPPLDHQGVPRIFKSTDAFRRAMQLADQSPNSGILFCVGTWAEMVGENGKGEDVAGALREFGLGGQVHQVHMRNITAPLPNFSETFPDGGYLDLHSIMDVLIDIDFQGMIVPDHVPGDEHNILINEAYTLGYLRALIQYAEHKSGT